LAALLAWVGPPGSDLPAHVYQRGLFIHHGFALWNNFWYAGRYSFVTYSLLYYPAAALLGIRLLGVLSIVLGVVAFTVVLWREWGPRARWSSRTFAIVWACIVLTAEFPWVLGIALALAALWALQVRGYKRFAVLMALALAASPLAFLLLALVLVGLGVSRRVAGRALVMPAVIVLAIGLVEVLVWRAFPGEGSYPFSLAELAAACVFCAFGVGLTWHVESLRGIRWVFVVYGAACIGAYLVPTGIGENMARLRFIALPVAVLILALREWRPRLVTLVAFALALSWNVTPLAASFVTGTDDPAAQAKYWAPAIHYLRYHLSPSYRVEAVDTSGHWPALYLPRAGIPLARGWFRQDDFPQNKILYGPLGPTTYLAWLRRLGVRYVVLTKAPPDYSAIGEARLLRTGRSRLQPVFSTDRLSIYAVPSPRPLITGPGHARVRRFTQTRVVLQVSSPGVYRLAVRWSPYWHSHAACITESSDGMVQIVTRRGGVVPLFFSVNPERALHAVVDGDPGSCYFLSPRRVAVLQ
jgi:hypothetical protein